MSFDSSLIMRTDPAPRIPKITEAERTDAVRAMFAAIAGVGPANIEHHPVLMTFAHHPTLTHPFMDFNTHLLSTSTLPVRLRQIAILRVAWQKRAVYMWSSHLQMSLRLGLQRGGFSGSQRWRGLSPLAGRRTHHPASHRSADGAFRCG